MQSKLFLLIFAAFLQFVVVAGQRPWVPSSTSAQDFRNPYTWYRPYYQAAYEAYQKYIQNSREISQQLQQQAYNTGAFNRTTGYGRNPNNPSGGRFPYQYWG